MTYIRRRSVVKTSILLSVLFGLAFTGTGLAQGVCPIKTVKLEAVRGRVVENTRSRGPVANVLVELRSTRDDERIISSVRTDQNGSFSFGPMKKGVYALDFRHEFFATYRSIVKTQGSDPSMTGSKVSSILIMLGADCFKTEVLLGK